jgi:hypothetical protein
MKYKARFLLIVLMAVMLPLGSASAALSLRGDWGKVALTGWFREYLSMNLQNPFPADHHNDRWDLSMARTSIQLYLDGSLGKVKFHAIGRVTREIETSYLHRLHINGADLNGRLVSQCCGRGYRENQLRELYVSVPLGLLGLPFKHGSTLKIGKQQVAFGNTDFFHVLDVVQGFDYTWRSFLVPSNEEIRKPLVMANLILNIPKWKGQAQFLLIPGRLNNKRSFGNTYDIFGGRWANQPYKAVDFIHAGSNHPPLVPYNYHSRGADTDSFAGAVRWNGHFAGSNYSVAYIHQHNDDPVFNSALHPYRQAPNGALGATIYPFVDILGGTFNTYLAWPNIVLSGEIAYTFNKPYNVGSDGSVCPGGIPGLCGITTKDTVQGVLRVDKSLRALEDLLHTHGPPFFSLQLFDTWIPGLKGSDDIVDLAGFSANADENHTILTAILTLNYLHNKVNPGISGGADLTYGGGFLIPNVSFKYGNHWRLKLEADLFFPNGSNKLGGDSSDTHIFGYFANNDQLFARLTYQF